MDFRRFVIEGKRGLFDDADGLGVQRGFARVDLFNKFLDAVLVEEGFGLGGGGTFVGEDDLETGVEEGEFP